MPINVTCFCGCRLSVANALAGRMLTCATCGSTLSVPSLNVLRQRKRQAGSEAAPSSPRGRKLLLASTGLLLLIGIVGLVAWLARKPSQQPSPQLAQADPQREPAPTTGDRLTRQPLVEDRKQPGPARTEPVVAPQTPVKEPPITLSPAPMNPVKPIAIVEPPERTEPVKPVVDPPKPKEPDPAPLAVKPPPKGPELIQLLWKLKEGETFYQELLVTQKPNFSILGQPVQLLLQYRIVSRFTVQKASADGSLVVQQKIESAKLLQADDLTQAAVAGAVAQLPNTTHTIHLNGKMEITQFQGGAAVAPGLMQLAGGQGLQMASLLDRDGWKELVQLTFFQMDQPLKAKVRWEKPLTHSWGPLGSWVGRTQYAYLGQQGELQKIAYGLQLAYKAPGGNATVGGMQVTGAAFQPQEAGGVILFDAARGKVVSAEERFHVKGVLKANLLGQATPIEIDEDQHFLIRIHEKRVP